MNWDGIGGERFQMCFLRVLEYAEQASTGSESLSPLFCILPTKYLQPPCWVARFRGALSNFSSRNLSALLAAGYLYSTGARSVFAAGHGKKPPCLQPELSKEK